MAKKTLWLWGIYAVSTVIFLTLGIRNLSDGEQLIGWSYLGVAALQAISVVLMTSEERKKRRQSEMHQDRPSGRAGSTDQ